MAALFHGSLKTEKKPKGPGGVKQASRMRYSHTLWQCKGINAVTHNNHEFWTILRKRMKMQANTESMIPFWPSSKAGETKIGDGRGVSVKIIFIKAVKLLI